MKKLVKPRPTTFPLTTGRQRNPSVVRGSVRRARSPLRDGYNRASLPSFVSSVTRGAAPAFRRTEPAGKVSEHKTPRSRVELCRACRTEERDLADGDVPITALTGQAARQRTRQGSSAPRAVDAQAGPDLQCRVRRRGRRKRLFVHARSRRRDPYRCRRRRRRTTPQRRYDSAVAVPQYRLGQELRRTRRRTAGEEADSPATHAASVRACRLRGSSAGSVCRRASNRSPSSRMQ